MPLYDEKMHEGRFMMESRSILQQIASPTATKVIKNMLDDHKTTGVHLPWQQVIQKAMEAEHYNGDLPQFERPIKLSMYALREVLNDNHQPPNHIEPTATKYEPTPNYMDSQINAMTHSQTAKPITAEEMNQMLTSHLQALTRQEGLKRSNEEAPTGTHTQRNTTTQPDNRTWKQTQAQGQHGTGAPGQQFTPGKDKRQRTTGTNDFPRLQREEPMQTDNNSPQQGSPGNHQNQQQRPPNYHRKPNPPNHQQGYPPRQQNQGYPFQQQQTQLPQQQQNLQTQQQTSNGGQQYQPPGEQSFINHNSNNNFTNRPNNTYQQRNYNNSKQSYQPGQNTNGPQTQQYQNADQQQQYQNNRRYQGNNYNYNNRRPFQVKGDITVSTKTQSPYYVRFNPDRQLTRCITCKQVFPHDQRLCYAFHKDMARYKTEVGPVNINEEGWFKPDQETTRANYLGTDYNDYNPEEEQQHQQNSYDYSLN